LKTRHFKHLVAAFLLAALLLVACSNAAEDLPQPTASPTVSTSPTTEPESVAQADDETSSDQCIVCHSDKQALIDTAMPEQDLISENEGEG